MHVKCTDTVGLLHAVGEQRRDDDTVPDIADLVTGLQCELHANWLFLLQQGEHIYSAAG